MRTRTRAYRQIRLGTSTIVIEGDTRNYRWGSLTDSSRSVIDESSGWDRAVARAITLGHCVIIWRRRSILLAGRHRWTLIGRMTFGPGTGRDSRVQSFVLRDVDIGRGIPLWGCGTYIQRYSSSQLHVRRTDTLRNVGNETRRVWRCGQGGHS